MIECDITDDSIPLHFARRQFRGIDRVSTIVCYIGRSWDKHSILDGFKHALNIILIGLKLRKRKNDPRSLIKYRRGQTDDKFYELKPYPNNVSLFFIRWGVFGFYLFKCFQKYWGNILNCNISIDIIARYSHQHPKWDLIIEKLNQRIEAGY